LAAVLVVQVMTAQVKFPERAGEWETTASSPGSPAPPMTTFFCLNDEMWQKGLTQNPSCSIHELSVTSNGVTYNMDCNGRSYQLKGKVELTFDGAEHMSGKGTMEMTMNGKTSNSTTLMDYRWKGRTCSSKDVNLKPKPQ
jgi:hypothetical protein